MGLNNLFITYTYLKMYIPRTPMTAAEILTKRPNESAPAGVGGMVRLVLSLVSCYVSALDEWSQALPPKVQTYLLIRSIAS